MQFNHSSWILAVTLCAAAVNTVCVFCQQDSWIRKAVAVAGMVFLTFLLVVRFFVA